MTFSLMRRTAGLVPRYNWDYRLADVVAGLGGMLGRRGDDDRTWKQVFGRKPVLTTSGRASLYAILRSLGLPQGSPIGVPLFCCPVVFEAIREAGMRPRFLDVSLDDFGVSISDVEAKRDSLAALVVVHMFGYPVDVGGLPTQLGGLPIVEDCAQSLFSTRRGVQTGFAGAASFFSFRSGKYVSAGEGSAIFASDPALRSSIEREVETFDEWRVSQELIACATTYVKSALYRRPWYGTLAYPIGRRLDARLNLTAKLGFAARHISDFHRAVIERKLGYLQARVETQRENSYFLRGELEGIDGVFLPHETSDVSWNYYQFPVRFRERSERDAVAASLRNAGIDTACYLDEVVPLAAALYEYESDCPNAELCSRTTLVLPNHYTLSRRTLGHIAARFREAVEDLRSSKGSPR